jgi:ribosomal-protein-alanine N-acetyltransferase
MEAADVVAVTRLEALSNPHPWEHRQFSDELANPQARLWVMERDAAVAGHLCTWVVLDEWHILNVATHPNHRRHGVARALLLEGATRAMTEGCLSALLEVRAGNDGALALYARLGFSRVGLRKGYYAPNREDAVLMTAPLSAVAGA